VDNSKKKRGGRCFTDVGWGREGERIPPKRKHLNRTNGSSHIRQRGEDHDVNWRENEMEGPT